MMRRRPLLLGLGGSWLGSSATGLTALAGSAAAEALPAAPSSPAPHDQARHAASAARPTAQSSSAPAAATGDNTPILSAAPLVFPRDHGSHPETGVEWWYVTGLLRPDRSGGGDALKRPTPEALAQPPAYGFQLTFFRIRRTLERPLDSPFAPAQIMLGHIAVTDLANRRLHHDQRLLRQGFPNARTDETDTRVRLGDWHLERSNAADQRSRYDLAFRSEHANVALSLSLIAALPPLLQGRQGWSQKGPQPQHASRYVSEPQLAGRGALAVDGQPPQPVQAQCWLDHEWSHAYLGRGRDDDNSRSVGWDWLGLNLLDGSALMLFQMRRQNGSTLWTGGTWRSAGGPHSGQQAQQSQQDLEQQVRFEAVSWWTSPASLARYPVRWRIHTPQGIWRVEAMFDAQEVDARRSTGFLYWEGVVRLLDDAGTLKGWGYLEMTGYAGRVPL